MQLLAAANTGLSAKNAFDAVSAVRARPSTVSPTRLPLAKTLAGNNVSLKADDQLTFQGAQNSHLRRHRD